MNGSMLAKLDRKRSRASLLVVGVDGCQGGWVAVALAGGAFHSAFFHAGVSGILERYPAARTVGVDIPIGLERGRFRGVDAVARKRLGGRASTLFETPPKEVVEEADFAAANRLCRTLTGKGCSRQSHGLRERILEVRPIARRDRRVAEVHPELSFLAMAGGRSLPRKKTWAGAAERRRLLEEEGIELPADIGSPGLHVPVDDVLDAAAAAWTAHRVATGRAERVAPERRARGGREIAIWI